MALTIIPITYKRTPVPLYQGTNFFGSLSIFDIATNWMQSKISIVKAIKYIFKCKIPKFPINLALVKEFDIVGVFWGAFTRNNTDTFKENMNELFNWFKDGKINPQIEEKFKLQDASKALDKILNRGTKGKVILYP